MYNVSYSNGAYNVMKSVMHPPPKGRPPTMKQPKKLLDYLVAKALHEGKDVESIIVPGINAPENATLFYPGLSVQQQNYMAQGINSPVHVSDVKAIASVEPAKIETDEEIVTKITSRFKTLAKLTDSAIAIGQPRGLVVSGRGGVGKTHQTERQLEHHKEKNGTHYEIRKGVMSAIELFMWLQRNKQKGRVCVLDDADGIFKDENALAVLKGALDTSDVRKIGWSTASHILSSEGMDREFVYEGSMIFITNLNWRQQIARGKGSMVDHMQALITRVHYLDLKLHTERELMVWIRHMIKKNHILVQKNLTYEQEDEVLDFMFANKTNFDTLSLRTASLIADLVQIDPKNWPQMALETMFKDDAALVK